MNNLKQIGLFAAMYTADNVSHYPTQSKYGGSSWDDKFSAYDGRVLTDAEIAEPALLASALGRDHGLSYRCPSDTAEPNDDRYIRKTYSPTQMYVYNTHTEGPGTTAAFLGIVGFDHNVISGRYPWDRLARQMADINNPARSIAFTEDVWASSYLGNSSNWDMINASDIYSDQPHHLKMFNFQIADGHVESMMMFETLIRDDGTSAGAHNVSDTWWDTRSSRR